MSNFVGNKPNPLSIAIQAAKKAFKSKKGSGEVIKKIDPNVPGDRLSKATRDLKLAIGKRRASEARLKQTQFEIDQANKGKGDYNFTFDPLKARVKKKSKLRENKMGGGMMGRRFGMKKGSGKKFPDLTGDGKVTFADILKGRGVINGKKKGNKNGKTMS